MMKLKYINRKQINLVLLGYIVIVSPFAASGATTYFETKIDGFKVGGDADRGSDMRDGWFGWRCIYGDDWYRGSGYWRHNKPCYDPSGASGHRSSQCLN